MKIDELLNPGSHPRRHGRKPRPDGREYHNRLKSLLGQATRQKAWTRELRAVLPDQVGSACRVVNVRGDTLVVACSDGAVATRLRFQAQDVIDRLRCLNEYRHLKRIEIGITRSSA